jgi:hypothetical protein
VTVTGPSWLAGTFAVIMLATSAYCLSRLVAARRWNRHTERDVDAVHVLMGVAMAGMLVPWLNPFWDGGWGVVFAIWTGWFAGQMIRASRQPHGNGHRAGHHLPHLLSSGAMLYMLLAVTSARPPGAGHGESMTQAAAGAARLPTLALVLALAILGHVIWTTDRLASLAPVAGTGPRVPVPAPAGRGAMPPISPRLAACCEIAMGVTMGYMLVLMV